MTQNLSFQSHDTPQPDAAQVVDAGLGAANRAAAPLHEVTPLSCFAQRPDGTVVGGAVGRTWGLCCELQQLWVDAAHRGQGVGTELVRRFEERAAARGCQTIYLDTFSFQARPFYEALGYRMHLQIDGFPAGISKYVMIHRLSGALPD
jgi:GNAT superfamily N-acetyltransferase